MFIYREHQSHKLKKAWYQESSWKPEQATDDSCYSRLCLHIQDIRLAAAVIPVKWFSPTWKLAAYIGIHLNTTQIEQCCPVRSFKQLLLPPHWWFKRQSSDQRKVKNCVWEPQLLLTTWETSLSLGCRRSSNHPGASLGCLSIKWFVKTLPDTCPVLQHMQVCKKEAVQLHAMHKSSSTYTSTCLFTSRCTCGQV